MSNQPRVAKVLLALLVSMTAGAVILMSLPNNAPSAGPFCLNAYYRLGSVEKAISSHSPQNPSRWNCIEVYFSDTKAGNIEQLAALAGCCPPDINCHFVICNGLGGSDGQILPTHKWLKQWSIIPGGNWYGTDQTIRICIVANTRKHPPTDLQIKRTHALLEVLSRKFDIEPQSIHYPDLLK